MPDISKLTLTNVEISKSRQDSPVQLNLRFNEMHIKGLENAIIRNVSGFTKDFKEKIEADIFVPELQVTGSHEVHGKILLLSLNGKGKANILLKNCHFKLMTKVTLEQRGEKRFIVIKKLKIFLEPKR